MIQSPRFEYQSKALEIIGAGDPFRSSLVASHGGKQQGNHENQTHENHHQKLDPPKTGGEPLCGKVFPRVHATADRSFVSVRDKF
jgi:hypothetical protein